jgi:hypothetical protein
MKILFTQKKIVTSNDGQTFMEFIMLLASLITISTFTMRLINREVAKKWKSSVELIVAPDVANKPRFKLR